MHLFRDRVEVIINTYISGSIYFLQSSLANLHMDNSTSVTDYMMSEAGLNDVKGRYPLFVQFYDFLSQHPHKRCFEVSHLQNIF